MMFVFGRNYNTFEICMDSLVSECGQDQLLALKNFESGFDFVCGSLDGNDHDNDFDGKNNQYIPIHPN